MIVSFRMVCAMGVPADVSSMKTRDGRCSLYARTIRRIKSVNSSFSRMQSRIQNLAPSYMAVTIAELSFDVPVLER